MKIRFFAALLGSVIACIGHAADWHVNVESGNDENTGAAPKSAFITIQRAVNLCGEGDTIYLHPENAVARQMVKISGKSKFTIEGNGVTLEAADPLPEDGWEMLGDNLFRRKLPQTRWDRHLLIVDGTMQRMNRTQSSNSPNFPKINDLKTGEFRFDNIEGTKEGWLTVCGSTKNLEWSVRPNGVATSGKCENVMILKLNARHALNDGFNVHGECVGFLFEYVKGYDCFDEGFSAHDDCEIRITEGEFWGNENGVADVNRAITQYERCIFRDNVNTDVLLWGKGHILKSCTIKNTTTAAALVGGPRTEGQKGFIIQAVDLQIIGDKPDGGKARVRVNGGKLHIFISKFENVDFVPDGTEVEVQGSTLNGEPLKASL